MALHLGVVNGGGDMIDRACDFVCGTMARIRYPGDPGGDICAWLCVYAFGYVWIVLYDVGDVISTWYSILERWTESAVVL